MAYLPLNVQDAASGRLLPARRRRSQQTVKLYLSGIFVRLLRNSEQKVCGIRRHAGAPGNPKDNHACDPVVDAKTMRQSSRLRMRSGVTSGGPDRIISSLRGIRRRPALRVAGGSSRKAKIPSGKWGLSNCLQAEATARFWAATIVSGMSPVSDADISRTAAGWSPAALCGS